MTLHIRRRKGALNIVGMNRDLERGKKPIITTAKVSRSKDQFRIIIPKEISDEMKFEGGESMAVGRIISAKGRVFLVFTILDEDVFEGLVLP